MNLIYIAALVAVSSAAKLDRTYLPPASSKTAGGSGDLLVPHFRDYFEPGRSGLPKGAEENEFDGVVVEAAAPGTRATGSGESGLGGSRVSYGSINSKVGEAAFRIKQQQRPIGNTGGPAGQLDSHISQNYHQGAPSDANRPRPSPIQSDSQVSPNFHQGAPSDFNRPRPGADQSDAQVSHGFHHGAPSDSNRPRPSAIQSDSPASPNFHQGTPSDFNRPQPGAVQSDIQVSQSFHQGAPSNFNRPRPAADQSYTQAPQNYHQGTPSDSNRPRPSPIQSDSQASPNFHQGASSDFNRPRPISDQSDSQVSHSFHQGAPSNFNRPLPAFDQSYNQATQNFNRGSPINFNRFRPATDQAGSQTSPNFHKGSPSNFIGERPQSAIERKSNTVRFENNVGSEAYNYAYETENGITAEERGVSINGVRSEGGFSYTGDDGKFYKITYTAGEGGYQPVGDHLPTPPPIPDEILKSLEQNAKEDAVGSDDDGSYDAAKYNTEDDYTNSDSSNSRQPASGKKPESDVNVSGTFINQNNGPFESLTNNGQEQTFTSNQNGVDSKNEIPMLNTEQQSYDTTKFVPSQNPGSQDDATITQKGFSESDRNAQINEQSGEFGFDDFSRPINLGSTQFNPVSANRLSNKELNMPTRNYFTQNQVNSDTIQAEITSLEIEPQGILGSNLAEKNINQHMSSVEFGRNPNVPQRESSVIPEIHSTLQPSLELTTPYEYFSSSNQGMNANYPSQNQRGSSRPTQQPAFSSHVTSDTQANVDNDKFITPITDANLQLHNSYSQQDSHYSQRLPSVEEHNFNIHSLNNPKQGQPYHYNQPSIIFNPYIRPTIPTFAPVHTQDNSFSTIVSTKYPSPPTVATAFSTMLPGRNMYNQNSNIPQSFINQNSRFSTTTKYPEPPSLGHIIPAPTSPTHNGEKVFSQHTEITQASVSPFPSISPSKYNSQQTGTTDQKFAPNSQSNNIQEGMNDKLENVNTQTVPNSNTLGGQTRPSQEYDGEVYEYNKPTETLITPTESDEAIQQNDFSQFGQKLKPSTTQSETNVNQREKQNEYGNDQSHPSSQGQSLVGTRPESQNFQPQSSSQGTLEPNKERFNKDKINRQPIGHEQPTPSSQISSGAFNKIQTTADYNGPFEFSSRIRPCCQGSRRTSIGKTTNSPTGNNFQNLAPFSSQNTNVKPGFEAGNLFSTQSTGLQKDLQNAQTTSQSFSAKEDKFDEARKPPRFDEASGYHY